MRRIMGLAAATLAVAVMGCGGDSTSNGGVKNPDDYNTQLNNAFCQLSAKCGFIGQSEEKQCETDTAAATAKYPAAYSVSDAVKMKRLNFDAKAAAACISANKTSGCAIEQINDAQTQCNVVFTPAVAIGGMCLYSGECMGGFCDRPVRTAGCPGTCKAYAATGGDCSSMGGPCAATDYCDQTTRKCIARQASGQQCSNETCQAGLVCEGLMVDPMTGTVTKMGTCGARGMAGAPCLIISLDGSSDCTPGLYCDATTNKCTPRLMRGGACAEADACEDALACTGLKQDPMTGKVLTMGMCASFLDVGNACNPAPDVTGCPGDATCDGTAKTCTQIGLAGAGCGQGQACRTGLYCDGNSMTCTAQVAFGGACTPPPVDMTGQPLGQDPCNDGQCGPTKVCALVCM